MIPSDTELVEVEKGVIRNAKFLRKAPPPIERPKQDVTEQRFDQDENRPQPVNPQEERETECLIVTRYW